MVSDEPIPHVKYLYDYRKVRQFREDLDFFLAHYIPIDLESLLKNLRHGNKRDLPCFFLSFDDGFRECHDVIAPILKEKGIPATFFINPAFLDNKELFWRCKASLLVGLFRRTYRRQWVNAVRALLARNQIHSKSIEKGILHVKFNNRNILDRIAKIVELDFDEYLRLHKPYLTSKQVASLIAQGFTIGAHSIDHPLFHSLNLESQILQAIGSARLLEEMFLIECKAFAFPHNDELVSRKFFRRLGHESSLEITFGSSDMRKDPISNNFQRFFMDSRRWTAHRRACMLYFQIVGRTALGKDVMSRV